MSSTMIEHAFRPDDEVWAMYQNEPKSFHVDKVVTVVKGRETTTTYSLTKYGEKRRLVQNLKKSSDDVFASKQELLNSL